MDSSMLKEFATRYTAAWCSQNAASVASFFAEDGSLTINDGTPLRRAGGDYDSGTGIHDRLSRHDRADGRLDVNDEGITYHWTLVGTNTGPGGTGKAVRISGFEEWRIGAGSLIVESRGHFDEADYQRQLGSAQAER